MPTPDVDVNAILAALEEHDVEYVVIGGFATEVHDVAIPPTWDIDITPAADVENLPRPRRTGRKTRIPVGQRPKAVARTVHTGIL